MSPVCATIRSAVLGTLPLPTLPEFITRHGKDFMNYRMAMSRGYYSSPDSMIKSFEERDKYIAEFGFAIPCREVVEAIVAAGPVVEIGAGTGYWAALIARHGGDVVATDSYQQFYYNWTHGRHFPVERLAGKTAVRRYPDRNVFCSWPSLNQTWFRQALKAMRVGSTLFYVEESATADDSARAYLDDFFAMGEYIYIPCFFGLNDTVGVYHKVKQGPWRTRQAELAREAEEDRQALARWRTKTQSEGYVKELAGEFNDT